MVAQRFWLLLVLFYHTQTLSLRRVAVSMTSTMKTPTHQQSIQQHQHLQYTLNPRQLNKQLQGLFPSIPGASLSLQEVTSLRSFLRKHGTNLDHIHVLTLLHRCARHKLSVELVTDWSLLANILQQSSVLLDAQGVGTALYSMRHYESKHEPLVGPFLSIVTEKIMMQQQQQQQRQTPLSSSSSLPSAPLLELNGQSIGNALYGLQGMSSESSLMQALLSSIAPLIHPPLPLPLAAAADDDNGDEEGGEVVEAGGGELLRPPKGTRGRAGEGRRRVMVGKRGMAMSDQEVSNALWGLQHMDCRNEHVRQVLHALSLRVALREEEEEEAAAAAVAVVVVEGDGEEEERGRDTHKSSKRRFHAQHVGMALYAMRNMSDDVPEVRELLSSLLPRLSSSSLRSSRRSGGAAEAATSSLLLDHQAIGNALSGFSSMGSQHQEVRLVLAELARAIKESSSSSSMTLSLNEQELSNALCGLQNMHGDCKEVQQVLDALADLVFASAPPSSSSSTSASSSSSKLAALHRPQKQLQERRTMDISPRAIASCIYGLGRGVQDIAPALRLVDYLASHAGSSSSSSSSKQSEEDYFSNQSLAMLLVGLKGMSSSHSQVRRLLAAVTPLVSSSLSSSSSSASSILSSATTATSTAVNTRILSSHETGLFFSGFAKMDMRVPEVAAFFARGIERCGLITSGTDLSAALSGLGGKGEGRGGEDESKELLRLILSKVVDWKACTMSAREACVAIHGLRYVACREADLVKQRLLQFVEQGADFMGQGFGMALYGLLGSGGTSTDGAPSPACDRRCLERVAHRLELETHIELDEQAVAMAVYALRDYNDVEIVEHILHLMASRRRRGPFFKSTDGKALAMALYGISKMKMPLDRQKAHLEALVFSTSSSSSSSTATATPEPVRLDRQGIAMSLYGLRNHLDGDDELHSFLEQSIARSSDVYLRGKEIALCLHALKEMDARRQHQDGSLSSSKNTHKNNNNSNRLMQLVAEKIAEPCTPSAAIFTKQEAISSLESLKRLSSSSSSPSSSSSSSSSSLLSSSSSSKEFLMLFEAVKKAISHSLYNTPFSITPLLVGFLLIETQIAHILGMGGAV